MAESYDVLRSRVDVDLKKNIARFTGDVDVTGVSRGNRDTHYAPIRSGLSREQTEKAMEHLAEVAGDKESLAVTVPGSKPFLQRYEADPEKGGKNPENKASLLVKEGEVVTAKLNGGDALTIDTSRAAKDGKAPEVNLYGEGKGNSINIQGGGTFTFQNIGAFDGGIKTTDSQGVTRDFTDSIMKGVESGAFKDLQIDFNADGTFQGARSPNPDTKLPSADQVQNDWEKSGASSQKQEE
jgi:hypothetical protein